MKNTIKLIIFVMMLRGGTVHTSHAQENEKIVFENTIQKNFTFARQEKTNVLVIDNVNGGIEVEGYNGSEIVMEIRQKLSAKNESRLAKAKQEAQIKFQQSGDSIIVYYPSQRQDCCNEKASWSSNRWNSWEEYDYNFDFKVKVPKNTNLYLTTINRGDIKVSNVEGQIAVSNVNGGLTLDKITGITSAKTVNGKVMVTYTSNPPESSDYKTLNGTITVNYQENLSADLTFKSMHGEFYTDFQVAEYLNHQVEKKEENKGDSKKYKVSSRPAIRIGKGGVKHSFETLNGDIYVKKIE
ncbi:MAG: hypothetical protein EAZ08_04945 [Cytophagales bacterium]|nr:MAG: hypothetical protein EAZ08_04945 [Cytophagales bacterium]